MSNAGGCEEGLLPSARRDRRGFERTPVTTTDRSKGAEAASRQSPRSAFSRARRDHWDAIADRMKSWSGWGGYYQRRLAHIYRQLIPPGSRILEIGCGQGDLLARLEPSFGLGVDFSARMIERAAIRHPHLHWVVADAHELELKHTFDAIILSDLVNDVWDVKGVVQRVVRLASPRTRIILNTYSRLWEPVLAVAQAMGLSKPSLHQNWLTVEDITGLLNLGDADVIRSWAAILCPLPLPIVPTVANRYLVKLWPLRLFALTNVMIAHRRPQIASRPEPATVSIVVPARNEAGNIQKI